MYANKFAVSATRKKSVSTATLALYYGNHTLWLTDVVSL